MALYIMANYAILPAIICTMTYFICVSRERLWARAEKAEAFYCKAESLSFAMGKLFAAHYDYDKRSVVRDEACDHRAIHQQLIDLRLLAGLYFPSLQPDVAEVEMALSSAFSVLRLAEKVDEDDVDKALDALRTSSEIVAASFKNLGAAALAAGCVERIGKFPDLLLHSKRRRNARALLSNS